MLKFKTSLDKKNDGKKIMNFQKMPKFKRKQIRIFNMGGKMFAVLKNLGKTFYT